MVLESRSCVQNCCRTDRLARGPYNQVVLIDQRLQQQRERSQNGREDQRRRVYPEWQGRERVGDLAVGEAEEMRYGLVERYVQIRVATQGPPIMPHPVVLGRGVDPQ